MYKLLLADDEPLVLIGLKSMLQNEKYGVEICATARNGEQALALIKSEKPDIVITDIKMPVKTGLELIEQCREEIGETPVFIMLTSYEEFNFAKDAMHFGAVDYLIKLELNDKSLEAALDRAKERLAKINPGGGTHTEMQPFKDRFFIRLYNGLFESAEQYERERKELELTFDAKGYCAAFCTVHESGAQAMSGSKQFTLLTSTAQVVCDSVEKYVLCTITPLDAKHFVMCLALDEHTNEQMLRVAFANAAANAYRYFSVSVNFGIGRIVSEPLMLKASYKGACAAALLTGEKTSVVFDTSVEDIDEPTKEEPSRPMSHQERTVASVKEYISSNLAQSLSLNEVAAVFGFTPNYLSQLFAQYSSVGFVEYITDARVNAAKKLLLESDKKIYEISEQLGFDSAFYFSKVFKKLTGLSPREYVQTKQ